MKKPISLSMTTEKKRTKTIKTPCAGSDHFVTRIPLWLALPMVGIEIICDHREHQGEAGIQVTK